jgi:hypothetical protein
MKRIKLRDWIWILLIGSLWGLSEALLGDLLYSIQVPQASVYLGAWALLLLAAARKTVNVPGTSSAMGAVAALFRLVNAGFFICHLGGIILLGAAFDLAASLWLREMPGKKPELPSQALRTAGTGILSAFISNGSFALIFAFVVRYEYWAAGGWPKVLDHTFVSGGLLALAAAVCVPLGWKLGGKAQDVWRFSPAAGYALALTVSFWIIGRIVG